MILSYFPSYLILILPEYYLLFQVSTGYYELNKNMQSLSFKSSAPSPTSTHTSSQTQTFDNTSYPPLSQGKAMPPQPHHGFCLHGQRLCKCLNQTFFVLPGNSTEGTPRSSTTQLSPTFNLSREYTLAVQTDSYNEMRSRIEEQIQVENVIEDGDTDTHQLRLSHVLHPNGDCVDQVLCHTNPNATLTRLVSTYFKHSEDITTLCLSLYKCVDGARTQYAPITNLLELFPYDLSSIGQSQCNWAFDIFLQFDSFDSPFPCPDSQDIKEMHRSFSQLQEQLDRRLHKSRSRVHFLNRATTGSAVCLIGTAVGVVVSAVVISTHALSAMVGLVATPLCTVYGPSDFKKKHLARKDQLDAVARGTCVLNNHLDTIDRLVARLYTAVESDRQLIRFGLERGRDIYPIHEVVKHLRINHTDFFDKLNDLEEHICICFTAVNKSRDDLLNQIRLHQSSNS